MMNPRLKKFLKGFFGVMLIGGPFIVVFVIAMMDLGPLAAFLGLLIFVAIMVGLGMASDEKLPSVPTEVLVRYVDMLGDAEVKCEPEPGTSPGHLKWMLLEINSSRVTGKKAHRWLAFVQGVLIERGVTTVSAERNFTRPYFRGEN